jgi:hypothetical protein
LRFALQKLRAAGNARYQQIELTAAGEEERGKFRPVKTKLRLSHPRGSQLVLIGRVMKNIPSMQMRTVILLLAFAVGLGIAVHPFFFIVALLVILVAMAEWTAEKLWEYVRAFRKTYRYL